MLLQEKIFSHFSRRKVKYLTVNVMGLAGLVIAVIALLFSQDQVTVLSQLSQELSQTPLGTIIASIKLIFLH